MVRTEESLTSFMTDLREIEEKISTQGIREKFVKGNRDCLLLIQNRNLINIALMVCVAAQKRKESRGAHFRCDYKETDDRLWLKNTVISLKNDTLSVVTVPVNNSRSRSSSLIKRRYGEKEIPDNV